MFNRSNHSKLIVYEAKPYVLPVKPIQTDCLWSQNICFTSQTNPKWLYMKPNHMFYQSDQSLNS